MAIERASDVTYVGADGADHCLKKDTWYQGFYQNHTAPEQTISGITAFWDGDQFLDAPNGEECEMHTYDFLIEAEVAVRPSLTPDQAFRQLVVSTSANVRAEMNKFPGLKSAESMHRKGAEAFGEKNYVLAHVWYLSAASMSLGRERFQEFEDAATNSRVLAFAAFVKR